MIASANEVMTLAAKAARGAGVPAGLANDFGRAALRHLCLGRDPAELTKALNHPDQSPIFAAPPAFQNLLETTQDTTAQGRIEIVDFTTLWHSYAETQPYEAQITASQNTLKVAFFLNRPNTTKSPPRVTLPDDLLARLNTLAARTFVPESEASRIAGAGAGLTDND